MIVTRAVEAHGKSGVGLCPKLHCLDAVYHNFCVCQAFFALISLV